MTTLKEKIVSQINATDDEVLLKQIAILLSEEIYTLTDEEKNAIREGLEDVKNNRTVSNEEVQREWDTWV